ncbi:lipoyl protein ligase domain-containing protein, partial [Bacillus altitudinis]|uniref:lipoyl protein ligase domain-containing protein n=1 Tax=Bacillus altitudinis TaxID=293387 RepID=UPI003B526D98
GNEEPGFNMGMDEALLYWDSEKVMPPVMGFYGWNGGRLSVGYFEDVEKEMKMEGVEGYGVGFVGRGRGGGGVVDDEELR